MLHLIDKSALVAEIEDKINKYTKRGEESDAKRDGYGMYWGGVISCLNEIRSLLDTLEVKEILAKDYKIFMDSSNAYIARASKRNPNQMTSDRDEIDEDDIMSLIDWYLDTQLTAGFDYLSFTSHKREGKKVLLIFVDEAVNIEE